MEYSQPPPSQNEEQKSADVACVDETGNVVFDYDEVEQSVNDVKVILEISVIAIAIYF